MLAITSNLPWPLNSGGHLRTFHLLRSLARLLEVRLIVPVEDHQWSHVEACGDGGFGIEPVAVRTRTLAGELSRALRALGRLEPYVLYHRHYRVSVRKVVQQQLDLFQPDVMYCDHLDSMLYRDLAPLIPCVLDLHNIYSMLALRTGAEQKRLWRKLFLGWQARLLAAAEGKAVKAAQVVGAVSETEANYFRALGADSVHLVPNGVDCTAFEHLPTGRVNLPPLILYVGNMSWAANQAAALFLAREVLPQVRVLAPEARLRIVGRDPPPEIRALSRLPGVEATGEVVSVLPHLAQACVLAVPLGSGGGTRLKILEAFAAGLPVVSTPVGCEGLQVEHTKHMLIAPKELFSEQVRLLLRNPCLGANLAGAARELVGRSYDWEIASAAAYEAVIEAMAATIPNSEG